MTWRVTVPRNGRYRVSKKGIIYCRKSYRYQLVDDAKDLTICQFNGAQIRAKKWGHFVFNKYKRFASENQQILCQTCQTWGLSWKIRGRHFQYGGRFLKNVLDFRNNYKHGTRLFVPQEMIIGKYEGQQLILFHSNKPRIMSLLAAFQACSRVDPWKSTGVFMQRPVQRSRRSVR